MATPPNDQAIHKIGCAIEHLDDVVIDDPFVLSLVEHAAELLELVADRMANEKKLEPPAPPPPRPNNPSSVSIGGAE
jgi:hypothetical protein